jgi:hypothetical protein
MTSLQNSLERCIKKTAKTLLNKNDDGVSGMLRRIEL